MNRSGWAAFGFCALFFVLGSLWISRPGIQADEALFAVGVFEPSRTTAFAWVFGHRLPLMQMKYLGSLKAWLYAPIFAVWAPSAASVRIPMVLAGAVTLWLVFVLLRRMMSERAGVIACALLAADPIYVWLTRCDWGPTALQHLLTVGGVVAFVRRKHWLGGLLFGLAFWDKAVFAWTLCGLVVATLVVFPGEVRKRLDWRTVAATVLLFCAGAYPLLRYNVSHRGATVEDTGHFTLAEFVNKAGALETTLEGNPLFGYLVRDMTDGPKSTAMFVLFVGAVLMIPWLWRTPARRPALFFLIATAVSWLCMAATVGGGGTAHHVALLWPWPHCLVAIALAAIPKRAGAAVTAAAFALSLAVTINYYSMLVRYGSDPPWSDAIYALDAELERTGAKKIYVADWGILESLLTLSEGRLPLAIDYDELPVESGAVYVAHVDRFKQLPDANREFPFPVTRTIRDSSGVEVYRMARAPVSY